MTEPNRVTQGISLVTARLLSAVAAVRPDERRLTLGAFVTLAGFMAGHALLETARDALFLASWPASQLPWAYLIIAATALAATQGQDRLLRRFRTKREMSAWLILATAVTAGFWLAIHWAGGWVFYALYVWTGVLATLIVVRFWTILSGLCTVTQAKRLFAVIGSGSVSGAIVGSAIARLLTGVAPARHLVLAAALAFLAAAAGPRLLPAPSEDGRRRRPESEHLPRDLAGTARLIWSRLYLRRVATLILLGTITFTLVDYVFKSTVDRTVPAAEMGSFFSSVYLLLNVASLLVQVLAVTWLVRRLGINVVQGILPGLLLLGAAGYVASAGLFAALALKSADGTLRHSLYRTGTELLFVPMSVDIRGRVKALIDVVGQRGGQALASLAILALLTVTTRETYFAAVAGLAALAWFVLSVDLRTHYVNVFRESLREDLVRTRVDLPTLDVASLESLLATLNEPDDRRVIAALDLLETQGKARVVPALILYHPSPRVVVRALHLFLNAGRDDCLPILERLFRAADPQVAAAALTAHSVLQPDRKVLRHALTSGAPEVAATALAGLLRHGWIDQHKGLSQLDALLASEKSAAMIALASAIRHQPAGVFSPTLVRLAASAVPAVRLEAVRAMAAARDPSFALALTQLLGERALRDEIRAALVAIGPGVLPDLLNALSDQTVPHAIRRHLPLVIAAFGTPKAADLLLRHLLVEADGMIRFKILRALGRLRADHPGLPLDEARLTEAFRQTLTVAVDYMKQRRALERGARFEPARRTPIQANLVLLLRDKEVHAVERMFRLLYLITNDEDLPRIHRGLQSPHGGTRAGSRELFEHVVIPRFRVPLLTMVDDLYEPSHTPLAVEGPEVPYESVLAELAESGVESLSAFAMAQIAALGLRGLRERVRERPGFSALHSDLAQRARETLARGIP